MNSVSIKSRNINEISTRAVTSTFILAPIIFPTNPVTSYKRNNYYNLLLIDYYNLHYDLLLRSTLKSTLNIDLTDKGWLQALLPVRWGAESRGGVGASLYLGLCIC